MNTIKISDITLHKDYEFICSVLYRFDESYYDSKLAILEHNTLYYMINQEDIRVLCRVYFIILYYIENLE